LTLLVGWHKGHPACKKWGDGGGGHWLVRMEWHPAGWSMSASVNLPLHNIQWNSGIRASLQSRIFIQKLLLRTCVEFGRNNVFC